MDERDQFVLFGKQAILPASATWGYVEWLNSLYNFVSDRLQQEASPFASCKQVRPCLSLSSCSLHLQFSFLLSICNIEHLFISLFTFPPRLFCFFVSTIITTISVFYLLLLCSFSSPISFLLSYKLLRFLDHERPRHVDPHTFPIHVKLVSLGDLQDLSHISGCNYADLWDVGILTFHFYPLTRAPSILFQSMSNMFCSSNGG